MSGPQERRGGKEPVGKTTESIERGKESTAKMNENMGREVGNTRVFTPTLPSLCSALLCLQRLPDAGNKSPGELSAGRAHQGRAGRPAAQDIQGCGYSPSRLPVTGPPTTFSK